MSTAPAAAAAATLDGLWQNRKATLDVFVAPCGGPRYCGTVVAARGEAVAHARETGVARLVGTRILEDLVPGRDGFWRGRVYAVDMGRHLNSKLRIVDANTIEISACLIGNMLCDTNLWRRVPAARESASTARR